MVDSPERALVGSLLLSPKYMADVLDILGDYPPEVFRDEMCRAAWQVMLESDSDGKAFDVLTVKEGIGAEQLERLGGMTALADITGSVPAAYNAPRYAETVLADYICRRCNTVGHDLIELSGSGAKPEELLEKVDSFSLEMAATGVASGFIEVGDLAEETVDRLEKMAKSDSVDGIATGVPILDRCTGGLKESDMVVLAARPSVGKTAVALNVARNTARDGKRVLLFSLEMSREQLMNRMLCIDAGVDSQRLRDGWQIETEIAKLRKSQERFREMDIIIADKPNMPIAEVKRIARKLNNRKQLDLIVIDYLQLMSGPKSKGFGRQEEVAEMSRQVKQMAREMKCPVLILSQLNRAGDQGRPSVANLRESGAIEQDADIVVLMSPAEDPPNQDYSWITMDVAKNRNGPVGIQDAAFDPRTQRVLGLAEATVEEPVFEQETDGIEDTYEEDGDELL